MTPKYGDVLVWSDATNTPYCWVMFIGPAFEDDEHWQAVTIRDDAYDATLPAGRMDEFAWADLQDFWKLAER